MTAYTSGRWASPEKREKETARRKIRAKKWKLRFPFRRIRKEVLTGEIGKIEDPFFMLSE